MKNVAEKLAEQLKKEMETKRWIDISKDQAEKYAVSYDQLLKAGRILDKEPGLTVMYNRIHTGKTRKILAHDNFTDDDLRDLWEHYK